MRLMQICPAVHVLCMAQLSISVEQQDAVKSSINIQFYIALHKPSSEHFSRTNFHTVLFCELSTNHLHIK